MSIKKAKIECNGSACEDETSMHVVNIFYGAFYMIMAIPFTLLDAGLISVKDMNGAIIVNLAYFIVFIIVGGIYYMYYGNKSKKHNDNCNV